MEAASTTDTISSDALEFLLHKWEPSKIPEGDVALSGTHKLPESGSLPDLNDSKNRRGIDVRDAGELSYEEFVLKYLAKNQPVVIMGCASNWPCSQDWVTEDSKVNCHKIVSDFPNSTIQVTETNRCHNGSGPCEEMSIAKYFHWWENRPPGEVKYLKDWHCAAESQKKKFYQLPHYFRDDWLNDYYDSAISGSSCETEEMGGSSAKTADYRFVYIGPKGSWTPLHSDVLRSYSWSTNICGRKRWRILPPELTAFVYDKHGREMAPDFYLTGASLDQSEFPNLSFAAEYAIEYIQGPQETIFIPCGWHHAVENMEDTMSINHNWVNGFSIHWTWALLKQKCQSAARYIEDCRSSCQPGEFEMLVDRMVLMDCGMNFWKFHHFLEYIAKRETSFCEASDCFPTLQLIRLKQIYCTVESMVRFQEQELCTPAPQLKALLEQVGLTLDGFAENGSRICKSSTDGGVI